MNETRPENSLDQRPPGTLEALGEALATDLASVFSVLPAPEARVAWREVLQRLDAPLGLRSGELKWAEFGVDGTFVMGGICETASLSTRVLSTASEDPVIAAMAETAGSQITLAGHIDYTPEDSRFVWFLPFVPKTHSGSRHPEVSIRGLSITLALFCDVIDLYNKDARLTDAEKRVLFQLTAGASPKEAARADGVSVETRRAQIKTAASKLNCAGQSELVRLSMGQLVHLLAASDASAGPDRAAESFVARHLPDARMDVVRLSSGQRLRVLTLGPEDGRPVLVIHGMMIPILLCGIASDLEAEGLRLIMPVRHGFLESIALGNPFADADLVERSISDIAAYITENDHGPLPVLGHSLGGVMAMRFVARYPHLATHLVLLSTNLSRTSTQNANAAARFYSGLRSVMTRPGLPKLVTWQFQKYYARPETGRAILRRLFGSCASDSAVINGEARTPPADEWFGELYQSSMAGISEDFSLVLGDWRADMAYLKLPATFVHGLDDPITTIAEMEQLRAHVPSARIEPIADAGHFAVSSRSAEIWKRIARAL
ncbi:MAG: alpha/beta fold hydrolase [Pseudomonadota bacterium]